MFGKLLESFVCSGSPLRLSAYARHSTKGLNNNPHQLGTAVLMRRTWGVSKVVEGATLAFWIDKCRIYIYLRDDFLLYGVCRIEHHSCGVGGRKMKTVKVNSG